MTSVADDAAVLPAAEQSHCNDDARVASLKEMEIFASAPESSRKLTDELNGVLIEAATKGVVRYKWTLLRPLLVCMVEKVLREYEQAEQVEVGPAPPLPTDESVTAMVERFKGYLWAFENAPWTLQRLCELLLQPRRQYGKLAKLALSLEKLLLVTSELAVDSSLPPPPRLNELGPVNENPPPPDKAPGLAGSKRPREEEADGSGILAATLQVLEPLPNEQQELAMSAAAGLQGDPAAPTDDISAVAEAAAEALASSEGDQPSNSGRQEAHGEQGGAGAKDGDATEGGQAGAVPAPERELAGMAWLHSAPTGAAHPEASAMTEPIGAASQQQAAAGS